MKTKHIYIFSLLCLVPMIFGLIIWGELPEKLAIHFDFRGNPDGFASKSVIIFVIPVVFAILNIMINYIKKSNPDKANTKQMEYVIHSIMPITSFLVVFSSIFSTYIAVNKVVIVYVGFIIASIGNFLPKCRHNIIIGIKLPTTIRNVDNWNFTHKITGFCWFFSGIIIAVSGVFDQVYIYTLAILITIVTPFLATIIFENKKK